MYSETNSTLRAMDFLADSSTPYFLVLLTLPLKTIMCPSHPVLIPLRVNDCLPHRASWSPTTLQFVSLAGCIDISARPRVYFPFSDIISVVLALQVAIVISRCRALALDAARRPASFELVFLSIC